MGMHNGMKGEHQMSVCKVDLSWLNGIPLYPILLAAGQILVFINKIARYLLLVYLCKIGVSIHGTVDRWFIHDVYQCHLHIFVFRPPKSHHSAQLIASSRRGRPRATCTRFFCSFKKWKQNMFGLPRPKSNGGSCYV